VTEHRRDGRIIPPIPGNTHRLVIEGDQFRLWCGNEHGGSILIATFYLNSTKSPRQITLTPAKEPEKHEVYLGIYELDGDTLRLCFPVTEPWDPRPTEFKAEKGDNREVYKLKRNKAVK
jgi:uncharacterized protein (TIGR03067 family)